MKVDYKNSWYEKTKPNFKAFDEGLKPYWDMKYSDRWAQIKKIKDAKTVLDIGCGLGRALSHYQMMGAKVTGIEPRDYACEVAKSRGIEVIKGYYENVASGIEYDVVHFEQVLSHTPDFMGSLNQAYRNLKGSGVLVIEEPNDGNALQKLLEPRLGKYWITEDHCNYFTFDSMEKALGEAGFEVVKRTCTFPMELFELTGEHYVGNDERGRHVHRRRYEILSRMSEKERDELLTGYAQLGIGRDLVIYCQKGDNHG